MGIENIVENDGIGIAVVGMVIVFVTLTLISVFIALLPRLLQFLSFVLPPEPPPQRAARHPAPQEEELIAAIGYVLHQRELGASQSE